MLYTHMGQMQLFELKNTIFEKIISKDISSTNLELPNRSTVMCLIYHTELGKKSVNYEF